MDASVLCRTSENTNRTGRNTKIEFRHVRLSQDTHAGIANMQVKAAPTPAKDPAVVDAQAPDTGVTVKKRIGGRFKPIWVVGYDEDEEKGEHIGFRYFSDGDKDGMSHDGGVKSHDHDVKSHNDHAKAHDDHESSFWY
ncbi:hypothetical protein EKO27_g7680 [Xylaria grammica]|uniref:Uncharacterized protein n=1 Tax=Xylaria grammica TaxID=363999 RepID=A0A439CZ39_9PEZI|nr:hypothetical protein EKO27_g7680 [Xylaria grammica]